ncbi:hypothetical protein [Vibrio harveyi]|uniref:hypothetical protein n=1 Tax=Vibrio harveyi TaxID=669 RepID=UPI003BB6FFB2
MESKHKIGYTLDGKTKLFEPRNDDAINSIPRIELKYHLETVRRLSYYTDAGFEADLSKAAWTSLQASEDKLKELAHKLRPEEWGDFQVWRTSLLKNVH